MHIDGSDIETEAEKGGGVPALHAAIVKHLEGVLGAGGVNDRPPGGIRFRRIQWGYGGQWGAMQMSIDPQELSQLQELVSKHWARWKTPTDTEASDDAVVMRILSSMKGDEGFWTDLKNWQAEHAVSIDMAHLRSSLPSEGSHQDKPLAECLAGLGFGSEEAGLLAAGLRNVASREARILDAFAAGTPAQTAEALEKMVDAGDSAKTFDWFKKHYMVTGTAVAFLGLLLAIYILLSMSTGTGSSGTLYKGVTPES